MKRITFSVFLFVSLIQMAISQESFDTIANNRPNILLIIADDLGFSDIGPYGGEIATPTLDLLAAQGIRFNNFHTLPSCAPTRSVLLTGMDNHIVGLGGQAPGGITPKQEGFPGYEGYLNNQVAVLPELLKETGYRTYHVGKWHLGTQEGRRAFDRGFQESFTLLPGGASHYADCKPLHPGEPVIYSRNGQLLKSLPADFYSTKNYTDSVLTWMERDKATNTPFFAQIAYTAPHDPLHAPKNYIKKYKGKYDEGYEVLREKRFQRLKKLGLIAKGRSLPPWPSVISKWNDLSPKEQQNQIRDMEIYAAMIDYLDEQVGRIYQWLITNNALENTLIVFMRDNGANGWMNTMYPTYTPEFAAQFDNSLDNRGMPNSFTSVGAGWATASTAAFRLFKLFSTEGGIRAPMIIKPVTAPGFQEETIEIDRTNTTFTHVKDLMPTFLALAKVVHPAEQNPTAKKMSGQSLLPILKGEKTSIHADKGIGYELHGTRAFIKGNWKILQTPIPMGSGEWELYNLESDPMEAQNLIFSQKEIFRELLAAYQQYEKNNGVIFDLPGPVGKISKVFKLIFWLLIGIFGLAIFSKLTGKLKDKYLKWGYGIPFMYGLAITELVGIAGLFTAYTQYAIWLLLSIMVGAFFTLIWHKESWKAYSLPLFTTTLLVGLLILKSGKLLSFFL